MCAIFGIIGKNNSKLIEEMSNLQKFRGPDKQSFFNCDKGFVSMGNNRLSIIDAENGDQPMFSNNGRYVVVFNGCIFNFAEIRKNLIEKKISFKSYSDTEVIVNAFMHYGTKCFNFFDGMWALSIYDIKEKKVFLSRDYIGQKPLYYSKNKEHVIFSSQINALFQYKKLSKNLSIEGLKKYHAYSFVPAPLTIYQDIFQIKPGEYLEVDAKSIKIKNYTYWDLDNGPDYNQFFKEENRSNYIKNFDDLLKSYSFADMKPAISLSGGIDSNIIYNRLKKNNLNIKTFTLGFENKTFDESRYIGTQNNNNQIFKINVKTLKNEFQNLSKKVTEPNGDSSILPTYILFERIKRETKVSLSGDGGDESFFGYITFDAYLLANYFKKTFPKFILNFLKKLFNFHKIDNNYMSNKFKLKKFFQSINCNKEHIIQSWMSPLDIQQLNLKFESKFNIENLFNDSEKIFFHKRNFMRSAQIYYFKFYLPMVLAKVDQASMFNSVENRAPFVSKRIINFTLNENIENLYSFKNPKIFLKKQYQKIIGNDVFERPKHGFAFQKDIILKDKQLINEILDKKYLLNENFFNYKYEQFLKGDNYFSNYIWNELILNIAIQNN